MELPESGHDPVLMREVLHWMDPLAGQVWVDCTLGRAGHALEVARRLGPSGVLIGLDVDPANLNYAKGRLAGAACQVRLFQANFSQLDEVFSEVGLKQVDGILADLGISTNQLFETGYGLSFGSAMPLDMRLDPNLPTTAADLVNAMEEQKLANVLYELAQERYSRRIARNIVAARRISPILTTDRLAELCRQAYPPKDRARSPIDPATRTFLALRMVVNREMENLEVLLERAIGALKRGGRFGVISFHSTEDRVVKHAFRQSQQVGLVEILTRKPVAPSDEEVMRNPRSRSAKLRVVQRQDVGSDH